MSAARVDRDHLVGELLHDPGRDIVPRGLGENDRRELDHAALRDPPSVDLLGERSRAVEPEVPRHGVLEARARPASVLAPGGYPERLEPDVVPAAPVAGDPAERREPNPAAVRRDADAVDARAADDRDAPAALGARAKDRECVVPDVHVVSPAALHERRTEGVLLRGEVDPGEEDLRRGERRRAVPPRRAERLVEQLLEQHDRLLEAEVVRRGLRAADVREQGAVLADERDVGLRVAAVDREEDPVAHRDTPDTCAGSSRRRDSISSPVSASWPISGCASSAFRAVTVSRVTAASRSEPLVRGDVLDEAEELRRERPLRERRRAVRADLGGKLDDVVVRKPRDSAVVAHVDHLHVAGAVREGGDERGRGLAVERAAALLEQRRLLRELRITVQLQELALDPGDVGGAGHAVALGIEHFVVGVEVPEVVGGDRAELLDQAKRLARLRGEGVPVCVEQVGQGLSSVDEHAPHPGQVVEPDLVDEHARGLDLEQARDQALDADRDVAEPDRAMAVVEKRAGDDPDRVREVDDPRVRRGQCAHALCDPEHHGDGAHRLREAAGARRLLADAPARERDRLVGEPRLLTADAQLEDDERGAVDGSVEVVGDDERALEAGFGEHAPRHRAHDLAALRVDVVQHELVDRQPGTLARQP